MKVMYVACNPSDAVDLALEREITELERRSLQSGGNIRFTYMPSLPFDQFPMELARCKPDILHFSAHTDQGELQFARTGGAPVTVNSEMLKPFLMYDQAPKLVYVNACESAKLAKDLISIVPVAIGTSGPITNIAARASAGVFYEKLIAGSTIADAYEASRRMIEALLDRRATSEIYYADETTLAKQRMCVVPKIVASPSNGRYRFTKDGYITVSVGLVGCPANTKQVIFFTDDDGIALEAGEDSETDAEDFAIQMCQVVRGPLRRGQAFSDKGWQVCDDFRLFACATSASGEVITVSSGLSDALADFVVHAGAHVSAEARAELPAVIARLRDPMLHARALEEDRPPVRIEDKTRRGSTAVTGKARKAGAVKVKKGAARTR